MYRIHNKFAYRVLLFYLQKKIFLWWRQLYRWRWMLVIRWYGISMRKVTMHLVILLMYFMCLTHPWREVQERFLIKLLELNTLNEHFSYEFLMRRKESMFLFGKLYLIKYRKLGGVIKPLQRKKTLNFLTKS